MNKKILFLMPDFNGGGAEGVFVQLANYFTLKYQVHFMVLKVSGPNLKKLNTNITLIELKKDYRDKKIQNVIKIIINKNNYNFVKIKFNVEANSSFDNYFKIETYKKIKKIVGDSRVASIGVDPMIAPMNDIGVIDGYHSIYTLDYKNKFRKIIENELEKNSQLKDYYDNWGNRVYLFYNDKNNLLIDFKEAKNVGADFIISAFPIENENLKIACPKCEYNNQLYLYKIL